MKVRLQISITTFVVLAGFFTIFLSALEASAKSTNPYLCRCTCFGTNTTVVPLFSPIDPQNPCTTCTRQFCLNQSLEACRGARIERPDADTGTGWEGEVWAKCLRPDSERDKTIISLYILVIFALLAFAALRDRYPTWMEVSTLNMMRGTSIVLLNETIYRIRDCKDHKAFIVR